MLILTNNGTPPDQAESLKRRAELMGEANILIQVVPLVRDFNWSFFKVRYT